MHQVPSNNKITNVSSTIHNKITNSSLSALNDTNLSSTLNNRITYLSSTINNLFTDLSSTIIPNLSTALNDNYKFIIYSKQQNNKYTITHIYERTEVDLYT